MKSKYTSCTAVAPSSTANLGPGYDVFGLGLDALEDTVTIAIVNSKSPEIIIKMSGEKGESIPTDAGSNSAGLVIRKIMQDFDIKDGLSVQITKGVPAGYGMGSSAASASAAAVAMNELYGLRLDKNRLVEYAAEGEIASAGIRHYDNVSGSLLGGFVIVSSIGSKNEFIRIDPPRNLMLVVAVPTVEVPKKKTEVARSVLPKEVPLRSVVHNISAATTIVAGFSLKDVKMISRGISDVIVEPARKHLIHGYDKVKKNALAAGALAVTISGAGPSMVSFTESKQKGSRIAKAMSEGFGEAGVGCRTFVCQPSKGAKIVKKK